jgi:hypothetical protein
VATRVAVAVDVAGHVEAAKAEFLRANLVHVLGVEKRQEVLRVDVADALDPMVVHCGRRPTRRRRSESYRRDSEED